MTTGFRINSAKDDAANFAISTKMSSKITSYQVAEDNVAMGMDMISTASGVLAQAYNNAQRLRDLALQARNEIYGEQSLRAIQDEANAIAAELERLCSSANYNGVSLLNNTKSEIPAHLPKAKAEYGGFISDAKTYTDAEVDAMTSITGLTAVTSGTKYKISSAEDLAQLATIVNSGVDTTGVTFVLEKDIDLSQWCANNGDWIPIGDTSKSFKGTFDGNGHTISNLKIDAPTKSYQGLFAKANGAEIKNVGIENCSVKGMSYVSALVADANSCLVKNCHVSGNLTGEGTNNVGGIAATFARGNIIDCYATGNVSGATSVGGITGYIHDSSNISNCYSTSNIKGTSQVGGVRGFSSAQTDSCYFTGSVTGTSSVGGLYGVYYVPYRTLTNSYVDGDVSGSSSVGGLIGTASSGTTTGYLKNNVSLAKVTANNDCGSFIGSISSSSDFRINIDDCSSLVQNMSTIGGVYQSGTLIDYDMTTILAGVTDIIRKDTDVYLQVGINSSSSSRLLLDTKFDFDISAIPQDISSDGALLQIDEFLSSITSKQTELGAVSNRLESILDAIGVQYTNLVSSNSTIKDADITVESSRFIKSQILQQASATLLATANQSPSIALQLI